MEEQVSLDMNVSSNTGGNSEANKCVEVVRGQISILPTAQAGLSECGQSWHGKKGGKFLTTYTEGTFGRDSVEVKWQHLSV